MPRRLLIEDGLERATFLILVAVVTVLFLWLMLPYSGAILWGLVAAIVFTPLYRRLTAMLGGRRTLAASLTLLVVLGVVIVPAILLTVSLIQEAGNLYQQVQDGHIDPAAMAERFRTSLPHWLVRLTGDLKFDMPHLRVMVRDNLATLGKTLAGSALNIGQGALGFLAALGVMLYLTFFLLRDGDRHGRVIAAAVPLDPELRSRLVEDFVTVVRATMKGSVVVAIIQGMLGGVIFGLLGIPGALLWGLVMGFFSLVPAVGTGIVWVPVSVYLLATGSLWEGGVLVFCGLFVIGLVDNLLRPILVGKDTKLPDFVVLIATVAGLELFGISGVIVGPVIAALFVSVWKIFTELREGQIEDEAF